MLAPDSFEDTPRRCRCADAVGPTIRPLILDINQTPAATAANAMVGGERCAAGRGAGQRGPTTRHPVGTRATTSTAMPVMWAWLESGS